MSQGEAVPLLLLPGQCQQQQQAAIPYLWAREKAGAHFDTRSN